MLNSSSSKGTTGPRGECKVNKIGMFSRSGLSRWRNLTHESKVSLVEVPVAQQANIDPSTCGKQKNKYTV